MDGNGFLCGTWYMVYIYWLAKIIGNFYFQFNLGLIVSI